MVQCVKVWQIVPHASPVKSVAVIVVVHSEVSVLSLYCCCTVLFSHGMGTLRCLQKEMATYRH